MMERKKLVGTGTKLSDSKLLKMYGPLAKASIERRNLVLEASSAAPKENENSLLEELGKARNLLKEKEIIVRNAVRTERSLSDSSKMLKLAHEEVRSKLISVKNIDEKNEVKNLNLSFENEKLKTLVKQLKDEVYSLQLKLRVLMQLNSTNRPLMPINILGKNNANATQCSPNIVFKHLSCDKTSFQFSEVPSRNGSPVLKKLLLWSVETCHSPLSISTSYTDSKYSLSPRGKSHVSQNDSSCSDSPRNLSFQPLRPIVPLTDFSLNSNDLVVDPEEDYAPLVDDRKLQSKLFASPLNFLNQFLKSNLGILYQDNDLFANLSLYQLRSSRLAKRLRTSRFMVSEKLFKIKSVNEYLRNKLKRRISNFESFVMYCNEAKLVPSKIVALTEVLEKKSQTSKMIADQKQRIKEIEYQLNLLRAIPR